MFGRSPLLPVNLLFDLSSDQWRNYQNYVKTWQGDTRQAYDVESSNIQQLSARSKAYYDRKTSSAVLLPGDCILVRNLSERGEPGKLHSHWELHYLDGRDYPPRPWPAVSWESVPEHQCLNPVVNLIQVPPAILPPSSPGKLVCTLWHSHKKSCPLLRSCSIYHSPHG